MLTQSSPLVQFAYLQALDLLTTVAFLLHGVAEANPMVRWSMSIAPNPVAGLLLTKIGAIVLAFSCLWLGKDRLLSRINLFFALLVAWNLLCLIMRSQA